MVYHNNIFEKRIFYMQYILKISDNKYKVGKIVNPIRKWIIYLNDNIKLQEKKHFYILFIVKIYYLLSNLTYTDLPIKC